MELKSLFKTSSHFTTSIFVASDSFVDISFNVRGIPRRKMLSSFFNAIVCSTHLNKGLEISSCSFTISLVKSSTHVFTSESKGLLPIEIDLSDSSII